MAPLLGTPFPPAMIFSDIKIHRKYNKHRDCFNLDTPRFDAALMPLVSLVTVHFDTD